MTGNHEARVNITWGGANGDLPDPVRYDAPSATVCGWVAEAIQGGYIPGIPADRRVDLRYHIVERFDANPARPYNLIQIRPKTAFG